MFLETSAKTGENVEEAFLKCSKTILAKIETGMYFRKINFFNSTRVYCCLYTNEKFSQLACALCNVHYICVLFTHDSSNCIFSMASYVFPSFDGKFC